MIDFKNLDSKKTTQLNVKPVFKKYVKTNNKNYNLISILFTLNKVYKRLIYKQIYPFFDQRFSKLECVSRKKINALYTLITMIEEWQRSVDVGGQVGALLTDLSKAFVCIYHELLIPRIYAYGFYRNFLVQLYLKGQRLLLKFFSMYLSVLYYD